jgi:hypothetical protein
VLLNKKHGVLTRFTDRSGTRPALECVHVAKGYAEGADGYTLLRIPLEKGIKDADFPMTPGAGKNTVKEALIPVASFAEAVKSISQKQARYIPILGNARVTGVNGNIVLSTHDGQTAHDLAVKPYDATFPDIDSLIPKHRRHGEKGAVVLALKVEILEQLLAAAKGLEAHGVRFQMGKPAKGATFTPGSVANAVRVEFLGDELGAVAVAMPMILPVEQKPERKPKKEVKTDETGQVGETVASS